MAVSPLLLAACDRILLLLVLALCHLLHCRLHLGLAGQSPQLLELLELSLDNAGGYRC